MKLYSSKWIIPAIFIISVACSQNKKVEPSEQTKFSKVERAKDSIRSYLTKNMHDPKSYESIEFGNLDSLFTKQVDYYRQMANLDSIMVEAIINGNKKKQDSIAKETNTLKPKLVFTYYVMSHKFRGKNSLGNNVVNEMGFKMDTIGFNVIGTLEIAEILELRIGQYSDNATEYIK